MKHFLQFVAAVVAALVFKLWTEGKAAAVAIWKSRKEGVHPKADLRLIHCRSWCPIFYAPLQTCGTPLKKDLRDMGCFCHMPTKAKTKCNCWLYDQTDGKRGWPDDLNDFPPDTHE